MASNDRLNAAAAALKDAADEFIAAHAEYRGGHAPVLWATYHDCDDAVMVCHRSWTEHMEELFQPPEPIYRIELDGE